MFIFKSSKLRNTLQISSNIPLIKCYLGLVELLPLLLERPAGKSTTHREGTGRRLGPGMKMEEARIEPPVQNTPQQTERENQR